MHSDKQNILLLFPDQLRADALSCNGCRAISTPHLDRLASEGVNFKTAISPSPLCVPARASLLSGRNSLETGVLHNGSWLHPDRQNQGIHSWPELLEQEGYTTAAIGKMHFYPWDLKEGFSRRIIAEDKRHIHIQDDYQEYLKEKGLRKYHGTDHAKYLDQKGACVSLIPKEHQVDTWVADSTVDFILNHIKESPDTPFAVMSGFPGPHCPYDPPSEYLDQVDVSKIERPLASRTPWMVDQIRQVCLRPWNKVDYTDATEEDYIRLRQHYLALVKQIDDAVGKILSCLDENKLTESTTVLFTSDHGDFLGDHNLIGKHYYYNQSVHIPLLIRGKGYKAGQECSSPVSLTDLYTTILSIAGTGCRNREDSRALTGEEDEKRILFGATDIGFYAAWKSWRLSRYYQGDSHLYNLADDPGEENNRIGDGSCLDIINRMNSALDAWIINSTIRAHSDKKVSPGTDDPDNAYNRKGWVRPYPFPLDRKNQ
ncbi:MAG: sulfatase-like hydrolase/transferase [Spirochaetales bacterium]|nr:sulfatase-like hydrolase/transferase [Spirochaetales bacterium]